MTSADQRIEIQDYVIKRDGTVLRWMSADQFLERLATHDMNNDRQFKRYETFRRMMEAI